MFIESIIIENFLGQLGQPMFPVENVVLIVKYIFIANLWGKRGEHLNIWLVAKFEITWKTYIKILPLFPLLFNFRGPYPRFRSA
jgi:hypothetical protein